MSKPRALAPVAALGLAGVVAAYAAILAWPSVTGRTDGTAPSGPAWTEVKWPFPMDQWGLGRAFRCRPADCGTEVTLYLRAKIGFCNCETGVADDEELERIGDIELAGEQSVAVGPGRPITVHWMKGRSRGYAVMGGMQSAKSLLAIAFNDRCDAIVATAMVAGHRPTEPEAAVLEFLNGNLVRRWAEVTLGL